MGRNRIIHPGLALNEDLAEASIEARYLAALLPCFADRDGKIENRPKRIGAQVFPYDKNVNITKLISELIEVGYVDAYEAEGRAVLQITNFSKYQRIHTREAASSLPDKPKDYPGEPKVDLGRQAKRPALVEVETEVEVIKKNGLPKFCPPLPSSLDTELGKAALCEWDREKRAKGQAYKTSRGWKAILEEFEPLGDELLAQAVKSSLKNNYAGLFAPKSGASGSSYKSQAELQNDYRESELEKTKQEILLEAQARG